MARRTVNYYLIKTARLTGWLLFFLVLGYVLTGFTLRGDWKLDRHIDPDIAYGLHRLLLWPLVSVFALHSGLTIYFALRRWGWIKRRRPGHPPRDTA